MVPSWRIVVYYANVVVDIGVKMLVRRLYGSDLPVCPSGPKDAENTESANRADEDH
jgi:hypothetical protein